MTTQPASLIQVEDAQARAPVNSQHAMPRQVEDAYAKALLTKQRATPQPVEYVPAPNPGNLHLPTQVEEAQAQAFFISRDHMSVPVGHKAA